VKIYLDIDETMLNNGIEMTDRGMVYVGGPAAHLKEFLEHILKHHEVYWLTTHCNGDATTAVMFLAKHFNDDLLHLAMKIRPTKWEARKIEAINLNEDFMWFDDILTTSEEKDLIETGKLDSFVRVDLNKDPDIFLRYLNI